MTTKLQTSSPHQERILVIGDTDATIRSLADALAADYPISAAANILDAGRRLEQEAFDVLIFDLPDENTDVADVVRNLHQLAPDVPVLIVSGIHASEVIVRAIKAGAADYIVKPFAVEKIRHSIRQALEHRSLKNEIDYLRREQDVIYDYKRVVAVSPVMQKVMGSIEKLAQTESTILITGETGTGKSFLSGTIHFNSPRQRRPFIKVNCANIPETLLESELFGHEKGSFTGADKTRTGRFEQANGGTLFLDEFCELGSGLQAKLLRALEDKSFERLGGNRTIRSDTRIIAATNRDIEKLVSDGAFREDLYYRINILRVHLPPLRERRECIEPLSYFLLKKLSRSVKKSVDAFSPDVIRLFTEYPWPGNIRQLSNTIERAILMTESRVIEFDSISLPDVTPARLDPLPPPQALKLTGNQERDIIRQALENHLWIQKDAARELGISPRALNYRIKKYGITHSRWRKNR
jgi:DNA-binding NtrC family response regulator